MMYEKELEGLEVEFKDNTLWITLSREEASNAFTLEMIHNLVSLLDYADEDDEVFCIVVTGKGRHFCAGGDVKDMQNKAGMFAGESNELRLRYKRGIQKIPLCFHRLQTPVVAMINGAAIGAGLDLACMCDIRIASDNAKFGETFAKLGLIPGDAGTYFLQRVVGFPKAMEMTLTADVYNANDALDMGLVMKVVSKEELKEQTQKIVKKIISNAPIATQMAKRAIVSARESDLQSHLDLLASFQGITQRTADHFEGIEALLEKRSPVFKSK